MSRRSAETQWNIADPAQGGSGSSASPMGVGGLVDAPERRWSPERGRSDLGAAPSYLRFAPAAVLEAPNGPAIVVVTAVGEAEGSSGAAAALACAGAAVDVATLLVEVGGRPPRPTLIASAAARRLEERLAAHLPHLRVAARGEVCHAAVAADEEGLAAAHAAVTVARAGGSVVHVEAAMLQTLLAAETAPRPAAALLRADLDRDRPLVALAVADLLGHGIRVAVLKHRLGWVSERRARFGALGADTGGLPEPLVRRLLG
jgi:hypothetical protein